jgi:sugar/nucleoside kinase (ribokinase family)
MTRRFDRLLHLGNVVIDIVLEVPALPERGGDVLAAGAGLTPGGGFNVMVAAVRHGLPTAYAGAYGSGPFAALARAALADARIDVLQQPKAGADTGFVVSIVDAGGERTFVTSPGAEATLTAADLGAVRAAPRDAIYLSGYGLLYPSNQAALLDWLGRLGDGNLVVVDPGPLVHLIPPGVVDLLLGRADWWTCNATEAARLTGCQDPAAAASALAQRSAAQRTGRPGTGQPDTGRPGRGKPGTGQPGTGQPGTGQPGTGQLGTGQPGTRQLGTGQPGTGPEPAVAGVLVRTGPAGCVLCRRDGAPVHVPGFRVDAVDMNGAGDAHTGTFIAALAGGADVADAARTANAAAALSVTRRGPATAPTAAELARFLAGR